MTQDSGLKTQDSCRYIYCIMPTTKKNNFGNIGINKSNVYAISYKDVSVLAHNCRPEPYKGRDTDVVTWVVEHSNVVETTWDLIGTVIPMRFDVIVTPGGLKTADEHVIEWLQSEYDTLKLKLEEFRDKAEFGIQVFWEAKMLSLAIAEENEEINKLRQEMNTKTDGVAYFYRQKIEKILKQELEKKADEYYHTFLTQTKRSVEDIHIASVKKNGDRDMLMDISVLIRKDRIKELGRDLGRIKKEMGLDVRLTGPWPPYSFVTTLSMSCGANTYQ